MDKEKLATWMEHHGIGPALSAWLHNDLIAHRQYQCLEDLATKNSATIKITLTPHGMMKIGKAETFEGEAAKLEEDLKEAKKTIKEQEKTIESLRKQIPKAAEEETEKVATPTSTSIITPRVRKRKP